MARNGPQHGKGLAVHRRNAFDAPVMHSLAGDAEVCLNCVQTNTVNGGCVGVFGFHALQSSM